MKKLVIILALNFIQYAQAQIEINKKKDYVFTISTRLGEIVLMLNDSTPKHKANFLKLTQEKFYDNTTFHREIKGFMIQGGDINSKDTDPNNDGMGSNGYTIPAEFVRTYTHNQGAVAAARMGDQVNPAKESSGCQFYIVENQDGTHFLDKNYTVFGRVIKGLDVVSKIAEQSKSSMDRPNEDIKMTIKVEYLKKKKIAKMFGVSF